MKKITQARARRIQLSHYEFRVQQLPRLSRKRRSIHRQFFFPRRAAYNKNAAERQSRPPTFFPPAFSRDYNARGSAGEFGYLFRCLRNARVARAHVMTFCLISRARAQARLRLLLVLSPVYKPLLSLLFFFATPARGVRFSLIS